MVAIIVALYVAISFFEIVPLKREKRRKETVIYIIFMAVSLCFSLLLVLGIIQSNLDKAIAELMSPLTE